MVFPHPQNAAIKISNGLSSAMVEAGFLNGLPTECEWRELFCRRDGNLGDFHTIKQLLTCFMV